MPKQTNISRESLMKLIRVSDDRTITKYIEEGILPPPEKDADELIFNRTAVLNLLGLKEAPDEPFMTALEAAEYLNYPRHNISEFVKRKKIPHYKLHNVKGSQMLLLKSEIDAALKLSLEWDIEFPNFVVTKHIKNVIVRKLLNNRLMIHLSHEEKTLLEDVLIYNKPIRDMAVKYGLTSYGMKLKFNRICHKVYSKMNTFLEEIDKARAVLIENSILATRVKQLEALLELKTNMDKVTPIPEDKSMLLESYDLSVRAFNFLNSQELTTVYELSQYTEFHMKKFRNIGARTIKELHDEVLKPNGLTWKEPPPKKPATHG